jgi:hypothetical protein
MRRILAILLAMCTTVSAVDLGRLEDITWVPFGGEYVATFGSTPAPVDDYSRLIWNFANTNNPTDDDSFVGTNTGTLGAGGAKPTWVDTGYTAFSDYYSLDGGDYIQCLGPGLESGDLDTGAGDYTIRMWLQYTTETANRQPFAKREQGGTVKGLEMFFDTSADTHVIAQYDGSDNLNANFTKDFSDGTWHYFSIVRDSGTNITFYIDTEEQTTAYASRNNININNDAPFILGAGRGTNNNFVGQIDGVEVYTNAQTGTNHFNAFWLTATNHGYVNWEYTNRNNAIYSNMVVAYNLDAPSDATKTMDTSLDGNHGTPANITLQDDGTNQWADCNGSTSVITDRDVVTAVATLTNGAITCWLRSDAVDDNAQHYSVVISHTNSANNTSIYIDMDGRAVNEAIIAACYTDGTKQWTVQTPDNYLSDKSNVWQQVTLTHDGEPHLYVNGSYQTTRTEDNDYNKWFKAIVTDATSKATALTVGGFIYNKSLVAPLDGDADEVKIFSRHLSSNEVYDIYTESQPRVNP